MRTPRTKVAIVGAGSVGATLAYATLMRGLAHTVALYDVNARKVEAEVLDLGHGIQFMPQADVIGSDDVQVCADADMVVVTAGAKQKPGQSRLELAESTVGLTKKLMPELVSVAPDAIYLMVTNPVDIVTYAALTYSGLPRHRVFGSGTVLDTSRLRYLVAQHLGVAVQSVHADIIGEHGDSEIPRWSSASIGGVPLLEWQDLGLGEFSAADRDRIAREVVRSAYKIIDGKGATNYAIAQAGSRIIEAVLADQHMVLPVSTLIRGQEDIEEICLALPCVVGLHGVDEPLTGPLNASESQALRASARHLREVAQGLGLP